MTDVRVHGAAEALSRSRTRRAASSTHAGPGTPLRSRPRSSWSGHSRDPGWSQPAHGGDGASGGTSAGPGAEPDEAGEKRRVGRRAAFRRKLAASWHQDLGRDREPAGLHRGGQRGRAGESPTGQVLLDGGAAGDPRASRAGLDDHLPAVGELGPGDLRQVPGTEQHAGRTSTEMAIAPVREEDIIGHDDQYPVPATAAADDRAHRRSGAAVIKRVAAAGADLMSCGRDGSPVCPGPRWPAGSIPTSWSRC